MCRCVYSELTLSAYKYISVFFCFLTTILQIKLFKETEYIS